MAAVQAGLAAVLATESALSARLWLPRLAPQGSSPARCATCSCRATMPSQVTAACGSEGVPPALAALAAALPPWQIAQLPSVLLTLPTHRRWTSCARQRSPTPPRGATTCRPTTRPTTGTRPRTSRVGGAARPGRALTTCKRQQGVDLPMHPRSDAFFCILVCAESCWPGIPDVHLTDPSSLPAHGCQALSAGAPQACQLPLPAPAM